MRRLIHSDFELDLSLFQLQDIVENAWFTTELMSKYTLPFQIDLNQDIDVLTQFISFYNAQPRATFDVVYVHNSQMEQGIFRIIEEQDGILSCELSYGLEEFPSWNTKLSELNIDRFPLPEGVTIYEHAGAIINMGYPMVNYNFPAIQTDKIDTDNDVWFDFRGFINLYQSGAFVENFVDLDEEITYNRNIMQPLPYLLYLIKKGIEDAGFTLSGQILSDPLLNKALVYTDTDYYTSIAQEPVSFFMFSDDSDDVVPVPVADAPFEFRRYEDSVPIGQPGKYRIIGRARVYAGTLTRQYYPENLYIRVRYKNQVLFEALNSLGFVNINVVFETNQVVLPEEIIFEARSGFYTNRIIFEVDINPIRLHDDGGEAIPSILNLNQIDLPRAVPDMTFGDLLTVVSNWFNYGWTVIDREIRMDKINDQVNYDYDFNLSNFEVKRPLRRFNEAEKFHLKFPDIDNPDIQFASVYHDLNGVRTNPTTVPKNTNPIEIDAYPLPLRLKNNIQTAFAFEQNNSRIYLVLYDGLQSGQNRTLDPSPLELVSVHNEYWRQWIDFRIRSIGFEWTFYGYNETLANLFFAKKVFAYNRVHIIRTLSKTEVRPNLFEVRIETEAIP